MNSALKAMHLCFATFCIFSWWTHALWAVDTQWGLRPVYWLYCVFPDTVPVSTYWDFPEPGPQYKFCQHHLDISSLSWWVGPVGSPHLSVQKLECCLGCTARYVEIQSNHSEREFHCNTLPDDSPTKVSQIRWLVSWFSRQRDYPGVYKFELTVFYREARRICYRKQIMNTVTTYAALALTPYAVFEGTEIYSNVPLWVLLWSGRLI